MEGAIAGCGWTLLSVPFVMLILRPAEWPRNLGGPLIILGTQMFFVVAVGGDWMAEFRFIAPIVPLVALLMAIAVDRFCVLIQSLTAWQVRTAAICAGMPLIIATSQIPRFIRFAEHPTTPLHTVARIGEYFVNLGRSAGIDRPTLLAHDAGGTSYLAGIRLLDLAGLCDSTMAKCWRDSERIREYIFYEQRPTFIYSARVFAERIGLEDFPEFSRDYVTLPPAPSAELDGYIRRVWRDIYPRLVFGSR